MQGYKLLLGDASHSRYCEPVPNITVTVPDEVYEAARVRAAQARTSVSALVRAYLTRLVAEDPIYAQLEAEQAAVFSRIAERGPGYAAHARLSRDESHDRDALR
jgi:plasmid stability protein